jgi:type I restriction enzyme, S subunit
MSDAIRSNTLESDTNDTLPVGWRQASLAEVAEIRISNVDKKSAVGEIPVRLCNYIDVYKNVYITAALDFMEATATPSEIARFCVDLGDVMITKDSETPDDIGVPAVAIWSDPKLVCGYHLALFKPHRDQIDPVFLAKQLRLPRIAAYYGRLACGSTRYGLSNSGIARTPLRFPPLPQQRKIARILTTVDNLIERTEALIAKYQAIKQGMMHDLFTRGVDEHGHLRPPYEEAPELYKPSELGWIPKEWEVCRVDKVGSVKLGRQRSPKHQSGRFTTPYLRVANVFDGFVDYSDVLEMDFTPREKETYSLLPGDILLNEGQSLELVGRSAIYEGEPHRFCFQNTLIRFRAYTPHDARFCRGIFKYYIDIGRFMTIARQTTSVAHLGADRLAKLAFPCPHSDEQHRIANALLQHEKRCDLDRAYMNNLLQTKTGLMQDLLTGKVRVKVNEAEEVAAHA